MTHESMKPASRFSWTKLVRTRKPRGLLLSSWSNRATSSRKWPAGKASTQDKSTCRRSSTQMKAISRAKDTTKSILTTIQSSLSGSKTLRIWALISPGKTTQPSCNERRSREILKIALQSQRQILRCSVTTLPIWRRSKVS